MARVRIRGREFQSDQIVPSPSSDNDGGERPVRKQLKETTIESTPLASDEDQSAADDTSSQSSSRGSKRSFEESRDEGDGASVDSHENLGSRRKRSRDCTPLETGPAKVAKNTGTGITSQNEYLWNELRRRSERNQTEAANVSGYVPLQSESMPHTHGFARETYTPSDQDTNSDAQDSASHNSDVQVKRDGSEDANAGNVSDDKRFVPLQTVPQSVPLDAEGLEDYESSPLPTTLESFSEYGREDNDANSESQDPASPGCGEKSQAANVGNVSEHESNVPRQSEAVAASVSEFWDSYYRDWQRKHGEANSGSQDPVSHDAIGTIKSKPSEAASSVSAYESEGYSPSRLSPNYEANPNAQDPAHNAIGKIKNEASEAASPSIVSDDYEPPDPWPSEVQPAATQDPRLRATQDPRLRLRPSLVPPAPDYSSYEANCDSQDVSDRAPSEIADVTSAQNVSDPGPSPRTPPADLIQAFRIGLFMGYFFCNLFGATPPDSHVMDAIRKELSNQLGRTSAPPDMHNVNEDHANKMTQDTKQTAKAPTKKRSREQFDVDNPKKSATAAETASSHVQTDTATETAPSQEKSTTEGEPEKKRHRDSSQERKSRLDDKAFAASTFGNTSASSPFAALAASKTQTSSAESAPATSASAFASSSLASFAGAEQSPFSALGSSTSSLFKPTGQISTSGFGTASSSSGFGALGSGFSGIGGSFLGAGNTGGLTSFASPNAPSTFGESKPKQLGAEESEDEEESDNEEEPDNFEEEKTDERFYKQTIETGEEEEHNALTFKARLYNFSNKEWKERGTGSFKLNVAQAGDHCAARMLMRADGSLRVILNSPLFPGMTFGDSKGNEPRTKDIHLAGLENGQTVPLLLRTQSPEDARKLYQHIDLYQRILRR